MDLANRFYGMFRSHPYDKAPERITRDAFERTKAGLAARHGIPVAELEAAFERAVDRWKRGEPDYCI